MITLSNNLLSILTAVVTLDSRFHQRFHPLPDDRVGVRIEHMSLVVRVFYFETVASRLNILVGDDFVTGSVNVSFDLGFLKLELASARVKRPEKWVLTVALLLRIQ